MSAYADIIEPPFGTGPNLMPGMAQVLYFCSVKDIATFGAPAATPSPENLKYVVATPHVPATGKQFHKMYTNIEKAQLKFEPLGSRDATGFKVTGTAYIPGDSADLNYFTNEAQGDRFIVIMKKMDGSMIQIGQGDLPATIRAAYDSETVSGDNSGYMVTIEAYMPFKLNYTAVVQLTPTV